MNYRFPLIEKLPPYVFAVINELKTEARRRGDDVIDLGMGNPDLATPEPIVDKLVEAARIPKNHRYSASRGIPNLRLEIARWYERRFGVSLDPDTEAIATIGAKEGFSHLVLALVEPGDRVIVPDPSYPIHSFAATIAGCELVKLPIANGADEFSLDAFFGLWGSWDPARSPSCWSSHFRTILPERLSRSRSLRRWLRGLANVAG